MSSSRQSGSKVGFVCPVLATLIVLTAALQSGFAQGQPAGAPGAGEPQAIGVPDAGVPVWDDASMCGCCCEPCCPWQVWASALFLSRSSSEGQSFIYEGPKGQEIISTEDLDFGVAWGPSVGLTVCLNPCNRLGIEFFAVDGWSTTLQTAGNVSVQFPSFPYLPELTVPGNPATGYGVATSRYSSNLYNTEINWYHQSSRFDWLTTLVGFRWIEIGEQFDTVFATGATTPNFMIDVNNHLYGLQLGGVANLRNWGLWRLDGWMKMGVYANAADQDTTEDFRTAGGVLLQGSAYGSNVAFTGDMGVTLSRQLTDRWSLSFSYMTLWVEGIALAPEQLDNSDLSNGIVSLDHSSGTFYHGGFLGAEYLY